jgi:hypothetical protein
MVQCAEASFFAWWRRTCACVGVAGGAIMLTVAPAVHDASSVPLLVIGTGWLAFGGVWLVIGQRYARVIVIDGHRVAFISPRAQVVVDARDIAEIGYGALDPRRMATLYVRTSSHGTIRVVPRLTGLIDVLIELRRINPAVIYNRL